MTHSTIYEIIVNYFWEIQNNFTNNFVFWHYFGNNFVFWVWFENNFQINFVFRNYFVSRRIIHENYEFFEKKKKKIVQKITHRFIYFF